MTGDVDEVLGAKWSIDLSSAWPDGDDKRPWFLRLDAWNWVRIDLRSRIESSATASSGGALFLAPGIDAASCGELPEWWDDRPQRWIGHLWLAWLLYVDRSGLPTVSTFTINVVKTGFGFLTQLALPASVGRPRLLALNFRPSPERAALSTRTSVSEHYSALLARSEARSFAAEQSLAIVLHQFLADIEARVLAAASHLDDRSLSVPLTMLPTWLAGVRQRINASWTFSAHIFNTTELAEYGDGTVSPSGEPLTGPEYAAIEEYSRSGDARPSDEQTQVIRRDLLGTVDRLAMQYLPLTVAAHELQAAARLREAENRLERTISFVSAAFLLPTLVAAYLAANIEYWGSGTAAAAIGSALLMVATALLGGAGLAMLKRPPAWLQKVRQSVAGCHFVWSGRRTVTALTLLGCISICAALVILKASRTSSARTHSSTDITTVTTP